MTDDGERRARRAAGVTARHRGRRKASLLVVLAVFALLAAGCEAAGTWVDTNAPSAGSRSDSPYLSAVACPTATSCIASGYSTAAAWNGTTWRDITPPLGWYNGDQIACGSPTMCLTSGVMIGTNNSRPSVWNGSTWSVAPDPTGFFDVYGGWQRYISALDCGSPTFCLVEFADGDARQFAVFDGAKWAWSGDAPRAADSFSTVSCSSGTQCVVMSEWSGSVNAKRWDGTTWSTMPAPAAYTDFLECESASFCLGERGNDLVRWDGTAWAAETLPAGFLDEASLGALSCATAALCQVMMQGWNGQWNVATRTPSGWTKSPLPVTQNQTYYSVDCGSPTSCAVVGYDYLRDSTLRTASMWNGTAWTAVADFPQHLNPDGSLWTVSCPTDTSCVALGQAYELDHTVPFGLTGDGRSWTRFALPALDATDALDLACPDTSFCAAVGFRSPAAEGWGPPSILMRRAGQWQAVDVSGFTSQYENFQRVTCASATFCVARSYDKLIKWDGQAWTALEGPAADLYDISCVSATRCVAAGGTRWNGFPAPAFYQWNGATWTPTIPLQIDDENQYYSRISCSAPDMCVAVGALNNSTRPALATWNGTDWKVHKSGVSEYGGYLDGVSCTTTNRCAAIGTDYAENGSLMQIGEDVAGLKWSTTKKPIPNSEGYVRANDVACRPTWCLFAGGKAHADGSTTPWAARFEFPAG